MDRIPFIAKPSPRNNIVQWRTAVAILMVALTSAIAVPWPALAQMEYDFNGDGKVTCADFKKQYPDTYTDEATKALQKYPDDPDIRDLDGNAGVKGVACEGQPTSAAADAKPAAKTPKAPKPAPIDPTPIPVAAEPSPIAAAPETGSPGLVDVPADVMARVEGCAVIAISRRDVVGAGCPGVGSVAFRIPDEAPSMKGTVIITPMASRAVETGPPRESTAATGSSGSPRNDTNSAKSAKSAKAGTSTSKDNGTGKVKKKQSAESTRTGGGKDKQSGTSSTKKHKKHKKQQRKR